MLVQPRAIIKGVGTDPNQVSGSRQIHCSEARAVAEGGGSDAGDAGWELEARESFAPLERTATDVK